MSSPRTGRRCTTELSLSLRVIRDFANTRTKRIVVDDPETYEKMQRLL